MEGDVQWGWAIRDIIRHFVGTLGEIAMLGQCAQKRLGLRAVILMTRERRFQEGFEMPSNGKARQSQKILIRGHIPFPKRTIHIRITPNTITSQREPITKMSCRDGEISDPFVGIDIDLLLLDKIISEHRQTHLNGNDRVVESQKRVRLQLLRFAKIGESCHLQLLHPLGLDGCLPVRIGLTAMYATWFAFALVLVYSLE